MSDMKGVPAHNRYKIIIDADGNPRKISNYEYAQRNSRRSEDRFVSTRGLIAVIYISSVIISLLTLNLIFG